MPSPPCRCSAMTSVLDLVIAHQGGWDEALFVAIPMAVLIGLLALAQHRAKGELETEQPSAASADPDER